VLQRCFSELVEKEYREIFLEVYRSERVHVAWKVEA